MEVFDVHQHVGTPASVFGDWFKAPKHTSPNSWSESDYQNRLKVMEDNGIDKAFLMPVPGYLQPDGIADTQKVNNAIAAYRHKNPKRFPIALGTVEPLHGDRSLEEIDRIKNDLGLNGIAWHHAYQGSYIDSPIMKTFLKRMSQLALVAFVYTSALNRMEELWRLEKIAQEFPTLMFVALDAFSSGSQGEQALEIIAKKRTENIVFDTGFLYGRAKGVSQFIEDLVNRIGSERLLFGSNLYSQPLDYKHSAILAEIREANISEADKTNILGENAKRLFKF